MTTFLLIRHAAHGLLDRAMAGRMPGVHLSEQGREQAQRLVERLSGLTIAAIYSSPLERALETAQPLAGRLGLQILVAEGLNELDVGDWQGMSLEELDAVPEWKHFNTFRSGVRAPGGEMMLEAQARVIGKLAQIREQHPQETVAVISHGDVIKAALLHYLGMPLDLFLRFDVSPASVSIVDLQEWGPRVLLLNYTGTLLGGNDTTLSNPDI